MKLSFLGDLMIREGLYSGFPAFVVQLAGCNLKCSWCDLRNTNLISGEVNKEDIIGKIKQTDNMIVQWTGGEPMLQYGEIVDVVESCRDKKHHLHTNATIFDVETFEWFDYICFSPKIIKSIEPILNTISILNSLREEENPQELDILVTTDLEENKELLEYATIISPLILEGEEAKRIILEVRDYCIKNQVRMCVRY